MNPFRLLFSFRGRTGRAAFLFGIILAKLLAVAGLVATSSELLLPWLERVRPHLQTIGITNTATIQTALWLLIGGLFLWMILALTVKRLHDRGHFGFWAVLAFVPMAAMVVLESNLFTVRALTAIPMPAQYVIWSVSLLIAAWVAIECLLLPGSRIDTYNDDDDDDEPVGRHRLAMLRQDN